MLTADEYLSPIKCGNTRHKIYHNYTVAITMMKSAKLRCLHLSLHTETHVDIMLKDFKPSPEVRAPTY